MYLAIRIPTLKNDPSSCAVPEPVEHSLQGRMPKRFGILNEQEIVIPTDTVSGVPSSAVILEMARKDPRKTSLLIQSWLRR